MVGNETVSTGSRTMGMTLFFFVRSFSWVVIVVRWFEWASKTQWVRSVLFLFLDSLLFFVPSPPLSLFFCLWPSLYPFLLLPSHPFPSFLPFFASFLLFLIPYLFFGGQSSLPSFHPPLHTPFPLYSLFPGLVPGDHHFSLSYYTLLSLIPLSHSLLPPPVCVATHPNPAQFIHNTLLSLCCSAFAYSSHIPSSSPSLLVLAPLAESIRPLFLLFLSYPLTNNQQQLTTNKGEPTKYNPPPLTATTTTITQKKNLRNRAPYRHFLSLSLPPFLSFSQHQHLVDIRFSLLPTTHAHSSNKNNLTDPSRGETDQQAHSNGEHHTVGPKQGASVDVFHRIPKLRKANQRYNLTLSHCSFNVLVAHCTVPLLLSLSLTFCSGSIFSPRRFLFIFWFSPITQAGVLVVAFFLVNRNKEQE